MDKSKLRNIIKEEIKNVLGEGLSPWKLTKWLDSNRDKLPQGEWYGKHNTDSLIDFLTSGLSSPDGWVKGVIKTINDLGIDLSPNEFEEDKSTLFKNMDSVLSKVIKEREYPKGDYVKVTDKGELNDLQSQLFDLIQNAYASIGGHLKFKTPSDILDPDLTYWKVADIDADPEIDVVTFGKDTQFGVKHTGMGHDGDKPNIKNLLRHKTNLLKSPGNYVEVSGPAYRAFVEIGGIDTVDDEELVKEILGPRRASQMIWHGPHPTDISKKGDGWYSRPIGGKMQVKIMAGIPR